MNFELSEEQTIVLDSFRRFAVSKIEPVISLYKDKTIPKAMMHELFGKLSQFGLGNGWVPSSGGGLEIDMITSGLLYEELARISSGLAASIMANDCVSLLLHTLGTSDQKVRYLPGLLRGELIASIALTEPGVGSQPASIRTKAVQVGNSWRIEGEKSWITNCNVSDLAIVVCRVDNAPTMILVERDDGYTSRNFETLGQTETSTGQVGLNEVLVPLENIVGERGKALKIMAQVLERARCIVSFFATGVSTAALEASVEYAKNREQWGKPIGGHQLIQSMLAEMATEIECGRMLALSSLDLVQRGKRCDMQASMAKWYTTEAAVRITSNAIQIHGSYGLSKDFPVERYFRDARMMTIPDGTTQIHKLIIGRMLTGISALE